MARPSQGSLILFGIAIAVTMATSAGAETRRVADDAGNRRPSGRTSVVSTRPPSRWPCRVRPGRRHRARTTPTRREIAEASARYAVPERLIWAVIRVESGFDRRAVSRKGARGLMQLMPETAAVLGVRDPFDPRQNIHGGTAHLRAMMERFRHDVRLAVAAYNAGEKPVAQYRGIPPYTETRDYVTQVMRFYEGRGDLERADVERARRDADGRRASDRRVQRHRALHQRRLRRIGRARAGTLDSAAALRDGPRSPRRAGTGRPAPSALSSAGRSSPGLVTRRPSTPMPRARSTKPRSGATRSMFGIAAFGLGAEALPVGVHVVLEDPVLAVVEDHEDDGEVVMGRGPQGLDAVHGRAVPGDARRRADGDGRASRPARRAAPGRCRRRARRRSRPTRSNWTVRARSGARGDRLVDDDGVGGQGGLELGHDARHGDRRRVPALGGPGALGLGVLGLERAKRLVAAGRRLAEAGDRRRARRRRASAASAARG